MIGEREFRLVFEATSISYIVTIILLFIDGLIFGVAARKGALSILLIVVGIFLAGFIGLSIPFLNSGGFISHLQDLALTLIDRFGEIIYALPFLWIVGFLIGLFV